MEPKYKVGDKLKIKSTKEARFDADETIYNTDYKWYDIKVYVEKVDNDYKNRPLYVCKNKRLHGTYNYYEMEIDGVATCIQR